MTDAFNPQDLLAADVADVLRCTALSLRAVQELSAHSADNVAAAFFAQAAVGSVNPFSAPVHAMAAGVTSVFVTPGSFDAVVAEMVASVPATSIRRVSAKMVAAARATYASLVAAQDAAGAVLAALGFDAAS